MRRIALLGALGLIVFVAWFPARPGMETDPVAPPDDTDPSPAELRTRVRVDPVPVDDGPRFRLPGLGKSTYRVRVVQQQGLAGVPAVDVPGGTHDVVFRLAAQDFVLVRVLDDRGDPSAGAHVDAKGRFAIPGLTEGTWRVCGVCRVSMDLWSAEAEVAAGEEVELLLTKVTR